MPCGTDSRAAENVPVKAFARVRLHQLCAIEVPQFVVGALDETDYGPADLLAASRRLQGR